MKLRLGASAKFDNIKAAELTSSGEDGTHIGIITGDTYHDGKHRPHVHATVHYNNGVRETQTDIGDDTYSSADKARHAADQEIHRMKAAAKRQGVPVITHTTGRDAKHRQERDAYQPTRYAPTQPTAAEATENRRAMWQIIGWFMFACLFGSLLVYGLAKLQ